jgi:hypothetical protein
MKSAISRRPSCNDRTGTEIGAIAPAMEADIIASAGNPLDDITSVRRVVFVMPPQLLRSATHDGRL